MWHCGCLEHNESAYQAAIEMMEQYGKTTVIYPGQHQQESILRSNSQKTTWMQSFLAVSQ